MVIKGEWNSEWFNERFDEWFNEWLDARFEKHYLWCVARFGTISTIQQTWKTPMEECYFSENCRLKPATLLKVTLLHGCFACFFKFCKWYQHITLHFLWRNSTKDCVTWSNENAKGVKRAISFSKLIRFLFEVLHSMIWYEEIRTITCGMILHNIVRTFFSIIVMFHSRQFWWFSFHWWQPIK